MFFLQPKICRYREGITRQRVALIIPLMSCLHGSLIRQPMKQEAFIQEGMDMWEGFGEGQDGDEGGARARVSQAGARDEGPAGST